MSWAMPAGTSPTEPSGLDGPWDLLVIGGGTAGIVAATTAASFGARVMLVERDRTGGDCLWTGCVPSKSLLAAAAAAAGAGDAHRLGITVDPVQVDFGAVMDHVRAAIATISPTDSPQALRDAGVHVVLATAAFAGPDTAHVDGHRVRFRQALLATGASPTIPPIPGLKVAGALTSDTVWNLPALPARMTVLGGGSIGCEFSQAFARLGSKVTLIEGADRILPREDPDAGLLVRQALEAEGVQVLTGSPVAEVETRPGPETQGGQGGSGSVRLREGRSIDHDQLLVAVGRSPRTSALGLDAAGVSVDERGYVKVNARLRTTNHRIWAAGDLTGHPQFTHLAGVHGSLAASNAVLGLRRSVDTAVPRVTFTHPEVAAVGVSTATGWPGELRVLTWDHHVDRAVADATTAGLTRLVVDRKSRIVGATIVGPRAGESLAELALAIRHGLRTKDLAGTTHAYPTYSDGVWNAAIADVRTSLQAPTIARAITALAWLRRSWLDVQPRRSH